MDNKEEDGKIGLIVVGDFTETRVSRKDRIELTVIWGLAFSLLLFCYVFLWMYTGVSPIFF